MDILEKDTRSPYPVRGRQVRYDGRSGGGEMGIEGVGVAEFVEDDADLAGVEIPAFSLPDALHVRL